MSREERPRLHLPLSRVEIALELGAAVGVLASVGIAASAWARLPDIIPTAAAGTFGPGRLFVPFLLLGVLGGLIAYLVKAARAA